MSFDGTCDFREIESCELLAQFIAQAMLLKSFSISNSKGGVKIEAHWAESSDQSGVIKVLKGKKDVIYECTTQKTEDKAVIIY